MNNYKGFIDNIIKVLEEPMVEYTIDKKIKGDNIIYELNFKPSAGPFFYVHDRDEIREFANNILFGIQGKQKLPQITINGPCDAFNHRDFMQSLFSNVTNKEHIDYFFDMFYKKLTPSTSLKALVRVRTHTDSVPVIEDIINYMLDKQASSDNKNLEKLSGILRALQGSYHYSYNNYKQSVIKLFNAYEPLIIENDKSKNILLNPREDIANFLKLKEDPINYKEYIKFLPLESLINKPDENLFISSKFQMYNFDLSFVNLVQNNDLLINNKAISEHLQLVLNSMNGYLNTNPIKGLVQVGEMASFNKNDDKTNMWFKINTEEANINETIEIGKTLFSKISSYHRQLVLENSPDVNIEEALNKSVQTFVLDTLIPNKEHLVNNKKKI